MALQTDIPTTSDLTRLLGSRDPASVSIYMPTTPSTDDADAERIAFKNHAGAAIAQLRDAGAPSASISALEDEFAALEADTAFWSTLANSLAIFATPSRITTFRVPNHLTAQVQVADRFTVRPLMRAVSFPQSAFVLALAQGSVRLLAVPAEGEVREVSVPDLPKDFDSSDVSIPVGETSGHGTGQKTAERRFARTVDRALRPYLSGRRVPLVLAAAQPLEGMFRAVNSYPYLAEQGIHGNPEAVSDGELGEAARRILDDLNAAELERVKGVLAQRREQGRASLDLVDVARAATFGAVDTLFVDIDAEQHGLVDDQTGAVTHGADDANHYDILGEVTRRVVAAGGRVLAVRGDDIPGGGEVAAILRYPV